MRREYLPSYRYDKKSYMSFRLVPISVTFNDLERRNDPYFALFYAILPLPICKGKLHSTGK